MRAPGKISTRIEQTASRDLLKQHERALTLLAGLHPCITIDGPPEEVALRIFDHVQAQSRAQQDRIDSLTRSIDSFAAFRANPR